VREYVLIDDGTDDVVVPVPYSLDNVDKALLGVPCIVEALLSSTANPVYNFC